MNSLENINGKLKKIICTKQAFFCKIFIYYVICYIYINYNYFTYINILIIKNIKLLMFK